MAHSSSHGPQMAILGVVMAGVVGYLFGHSTGSGAQQDHYARMLRRQEVSDACRQEITSAFEANYWHEDAKRDAYRGYDRY